MHVRLSLMTTDPVRLDDAVNFIESEARPLVESKPGNVGMSLEVNPELGVAVVQSFWVSGDALRDSEKPVAATREEAVRRGKGTVTVERYRVASFVRVARPDTGAGTRLTRADTEPAAVEQAVAAYEDTAVPSLMSTDGFCDSVLLVDLRTGRSIARTVWLDERALAESRSAAAAIRVDAVTATSCSIRALEEYRLEFNSANPD
jgi:hypothetical protein